MIAPGQTIARRFPISSPATGGKVDADALPVAVVLRNGVVDGAVTVTVTRAALGEYAYAFAVPATYAQRDSVEVEASATVGGVTGSAVVFGDFVLLRDVDTPRPQILFDDPAEDLQTTTGLLTTRDGQGNLLPNTPIQFQLILPEEEDLDSYSTEIFQRSSGADAVLREPFPQGATYQARRGGGKWVRFTAGTDTSFALPRVLGGGVLGARGRLPPSCRTCYAFRRAGLLSA